MFKLYVTLKDFLFTLIAANQAQYMIQSFLQIQTSDPALPAIFCKYYLGR